jgi:mannose-6-phosphate isomerase-like protein (cupin superfamily)
MKIRHKKYGQVVNKAWGNEIRIVSNEDNNYSGKILNINQNNSTSTHFHSKKHKTFYVLSGTLTVEIVEPDTAELMSYDVDSEETFEIEQNVAHKLLAKDGGVTVIEMSTYHEDNDVYRVLVKQ